MKSAEPATLMPQRTRRPNQQEGNVPREFQDEEEEKDARENDHDMLRQPEDDFHDPAMCAITYQQLMDLEVKARKKLGRIAYARATMRDVNHAIIEPSCQETWKPYALQLNPQGLKCDAFITHAWDEPFPAFVEVGLIRMSCQLPIPLLQAECILNMLFLSLDSYSRFDRCFIRK